MLFLSSHASFTYLLSYAPPTCQLCPHTLSTPPTCPLIPRSPGSARERTYFVWLPLANTSSFSFQNFIFVNANVLPTIPSHPTPSHLLFSPNTTTTKPYPLEEKEKDLHLSHVTSALTLFPTGPPDARYVTNHSLSTLSNLSNPSNQPPPPQTSKKKKAYR